MSRGGSGYRLASVLAVLGNLVFVAALYAWLPDPYPTRFDAGGAAVGFTHKPFGPFITPLLNVGALLGMFVFPRISPQRFRVDSFRCTFDMIYFVSIAASVCTSVIGVVQVLGVAVPVGLGRLPISVALIVFGNFLGKTTKNFWLGIRTPWSLASDEVWLKTHRLAGVLFMGAGVVSLAAALAGTNPLLPMVLVLLALFTAVVASYVFYRRVEGSVEE